MRYFLVDKTVFDNNKVGMYGKLIYAILCKFANADGMCFPSRKTISKCGSFSVSTYNKYVSIMLLENVLEKKIRWRNNGSQTSNLFNLKNNKRNSFPVRNDIFNKGLSSTALCVYICLARYVAEDNCCRVSQHLIAEKCSISIVSVIRAVKELKSANMLETIKQTNISNNGNYVLLYRLTDGREYKNVIRRKIDVENTKIANAHMKSYRDLNAIEKRLNSITMPFATPLHMTYSPYAPDTPPELYLY